MLSKMENTQPQQKDLVYKGCRFQSIFEQLQSLLNFKQKILILQGQSFWNMFNERFAEDSWHVVFKLMKQADCEALDVSYNYRPKIIQQIRRPIYQRLHSLNLSDNNINNIQSLQLLNVNALVHLDLQHNNITCLKPLNKVKFCKDSQISSADFYLDLNLFSQFDILRYQLNINFVHIRLSSKLNHINDHTYDIYPQNLTNLIVKNSANQFYMVNRNSINKQFLHKIALKRQKKYGYVKIQYLDEQNVEQQDIDD